MIWIMSISPGYGHCHSSIRVRFSLVSDPLEDQASKTLHCAIGMDFWSQKLFSVELNCLRDRSEIGPGAFFFFQLLCFGDVESNLFRVNSPFSFGNEIKQHDMFSVVCCLCVSKLDLNSLTDLYENVYSRFAVWYYPASYILNSCSWKPKHGNHTN
jgi:hypothetical protein